MENLSNPAYSNNKDIAENITEIGNSLNFVRTLATQEGKSRYLDYLKSKLNEEEIELIRDEIKNYVGNSINYYTVRPDLRNKFGDEKVLEYEQLESAIFSLEEKNIAIIQGDLANTLLDSIISNASNAEVINESRLFIANSKLSNLASYSFEEGRIIYILTSKDAKIPLGMFISAESFESWRGRKEGHSKDGRPSNVVIDEYSEMKTTPPPIEIAEAYLLPDGRIYFKSENSHRLAAAIKRGDEYVRFKGSLRLIILKDTPDFLSS
jgi:hypothetical protein